MINIFLFLLALTFLCFLSFWLDLLPVFIQSCMLDLKSGAFDRAGQPSRFEKNYVFFSHKDSLCEHALSKVKLFKVYS
jgi:hypothetical protein